MNLLNTTLLHGELYIEAYTLVDISTANDDRTMLSFLEYIACVF